VFFYKYPEDFEMTAFSRRFAKLIIGLFIFALGVVMLMKGNVGFAPWDVLNQGLALNTGMTIGIANTVVAIVVCVIAYLLGEMVGIGSLLNMTLIGVFLDLMLAFEIVPQMNTFFSGIMMIVAGLFVISIGSYFYIGSGFGAGPRDALMVAIERKTGITVGAARVIVEGTALLSGWLLGGPVGIGTVVSAFGIGVAIQIVFKVLKFDPARVKHESVAETIDYLKAAKRLY
jgi:hypothetical protein